MTGAAISSQLLTLTQSLPEPLSKLMLKPKGEGRCTQDASESARLVQPTAVPLD